MTRQRTRPPQAPAVDSACVEARGLALGLRRAWRLRLPSSALKLWRRTWRTHGLHLTTSQHRFEVEQGGVLRPIASGLGDTGVHLVVLAPDLDFARACLAEELRNVARGAAADRDQLRATLETHRRLGGAYGYPDCCVAAFCDAHVETVLRRHRWRLSEPDARETGAQDTRDPIHRGDNGLAIARAAGRSARYDPLLAAIPGALGVSAETTLRHLPCRFDCPASRRLADALLRDLATADSQRHRRLREGVRRPVLIDRHGHAELAISATLQTASTSPPSWLVRLSGDHQLDVPLAPLPGRPELPLLLPFHLAAEAMAPTRPRTTPSPNE